MYSISSLIKAVVVFVIVFYSPFASSFFYPRFILSCPFQNSEFDELLLATLGAIHNLSFYQPNEIDYQQTDGDGSKEMKHPESMIKQIATISVALCAIYQWAPEPIQTEIARVLGNLTRSLDARAAVHSAGGLQFLLKNLSSDDWDIVETSCGVLVNMLVWNFATLSFHYFCEFVFLFNILYKIDSERLGTTSTIS